MVAELQALILISQTLAILRQSRKQLFIELFQCLALQGNYFDKGLIKEAIACYQTINSLYSTINKISSQMMSIY
jgi:hypothetical protein